MPFDAREATIESVHQAIFAGQATCRDVVEAFIARIEAFNKHTNAILTLNPLALDRADALDGQLAAGNATGPLFGIPVFLKDNFDDADMPTTGASLALAGLRPKIDAPSVTALKRAGAIILGKASLHELALEGISVSSLGGQTINPFDVTRTPGGSSGGSGAVVAASFSVFSTGTDTVNSLRSPASANSLFSIRPTRGLITTQGIIPVSSTQDAIGPITRTTKDLAIALTVMASSGFDDTIYKKSAMVPTGLRDKDYRASLTSGSLRGLRIGVLNGFFNFADHSPEVAPVNKAIDAMMKRMAAAGVTLIPINDTIYDATAIAAQLDVQRFEFRELIDQYLQRSHLSGDFPKTLRELYDMKATNGSGGKFVVLPSGYEYVHTALVSSTGDAKYVERQHEIQNLKLALASTFSSNQLDAIVYPEQKNLVVKIGSPLQSGRNGILAAVTGSPVVTVPAGFSEPSAEAPLGVPIGMEILGRPWSEEQLLQIAYEIEQLSHIRKPPRWATEAVEVVHYPRVPVIVPDTTNIPSVYPLGTL